MAGVYGGILALGYNTELQAEEEAAGARNAGRTCSIPRYKNEVMLGNPNSSGTAYLMLASLVQVFGEDEAFKYMKALNANVELVRALRHRPDDRRQARRDLRRQHGAARRDQRDRRAASRCKPVLPCEGVGYEIGSMAIIKGARNLDAAKKFVDWALTRRGAEDRARRQGIRDPDQQERRRCRRQVPNLTDFKVINYDFAKYGSSETRKRLLERWEKEIGQAPR